MIFLRIFVVVLSLSNITGLRAMDIPAKIDLYAYELPRFVWVKDGVVDGPAIAAFLAFTESLNIDVNIIMQPYARVQVASGKQPNSCMFLVGNLPQRQDEIEFTLKLAASPVNLYGLQKEQLVDADFYGSFVVAANTFEHNIVIDELGLNKILVKDAQSSFRMLELGRADYLLISEVVAMSLMKANQVTLYPVKYITEGSTWLACNKVNPFPAKEKLKKMFKEFALSGRLGKIYSDYNVSPTFDYLYHPDTGRLFQSPTY